MTTIKAADKRERLIEAAARLVHQQGFEHTTLADIAVSAEVPLGNVYYYFKTKDDIGKAIVAKHAETFEAFAKGAEQLADPRERLMAQVDIAVASRDMVAESGCPVGSFCQEISKQSGALTAESAALLGRMLQWMTTQFRAIRPEQAKANAEHLLAALQGAALLTNAFSDPKLMQREGHRLKQWLKELD
jgi:TetR/AcrR family transcriptional regulator, transcriptional repressor for nem operon